MPQLNHTIDMPTARGGLVADMRHVDVITRLAEDAIGAGAGLGRSHALDFARRGARVVVNDLGSINVMNHRYSCQKQCGQFVCQYR